MAEPETLTIHTDGASRGNPGPAAFAYVIERPGRPPVEEAETLGRTTNNLAEYTALVEALKHALTLGSDFKVVVHSDSELMVKQLTGEYRVKNEELRPLYEEALDLKRRFAGGVTFRHVRRGQNARADELCNRALDGDGLARRAVPAPRSAAAPRPGGLHAEAVACLRDAAARWAEGGGPTPEALWVRLAALVRQHCLDQLTPP